MGRTKLQTILKYISIFIFNFICVALIFVSGSFSSITLREDIASKISNLAGDEYLNIYQKEIQGVEYFNRNSINDVLEIVNRENNLSYSYNAFQSGLTYGVHGGNIKIDSLKINNDLVFLVSSIFSNHINTSNQIIMDAYYLELMFKDSNIDYFGYDNFCYITKQQADYLLESNPIYSSYEDLLNESLIVEIDGETYNWKISNIIIPFGEYYEGCVKTFNNFMLCYINLPTYNYVSVSHFYLNDTKFNFFKIRDTFNKYNDKNLEYNVFLKNSYDINDANYIKDFYNGKIESKNAIFIPIFIFNILLSICWFIYLFLSKIGTFYKTIFTFASLFFGYLVFYAIFKITYNIMYFSFFSNMYLLIFILICSCILFAAHRLTRGKKNA